MLEGWAVSFALVWPNILWALFPPRDVPGTSLYTISPWRCLAEILERVGQMGVFVVPLFCRVELGGVGERVCFGIMAFAAGVYYLGWGRYFLGGRRHSDLYRPLFQIPFPLTIAPIVYFSAAAVVLRAPALAAAVALFGGPHLYLSYQGSKGIRSSHASFAPGPSSPRQRVPLEKGTG